MALPLPRVVPDVGPGGGLVTAMGGINALSNEMLLRKINAIKAQYAPLTTQAEAASKLAYANLAGPQYVAKLLGNEGIVANLGNNQAQQALQTVTNAGIGGGNAGNIFSQLQQQSLSPGQQLGNSVSNLLSNLFGGKRNTGSNFTGSSTSSSQVDNVLNKIAHVESEGAKNPYQLIGKDTGKGDHALGKYQVLTSNVPEWTKEALGQSLTPEQFLNSPQAQEQVARYMVSKHLSKGYSPEDVGSIWFSGKPLAQAGNVRDSYGTSVPDYIRKMNEVPSENTWAENYGRYKSIVEEGKELGTIRGQSVKELDNDYQQALNLKTPIDQIGTLLANPRFQKLRNIPGFQKLQLKGEANFGNKEDQELIGQWQNAARALVANTVKGFGGRILASEIPLAESMKLSEDDSNGVLLGKWPSIKAFNEMTIQRSRIASTLIEKYHINKGQALEAADMMVNGEAIRKKAQAELNPITEEDIALTAKKRGMTPEEVIQRLRKEGRYNG